MELSPRVKPSSFNPSPSALAPAEQKESNFISEHLPSEELRVKRSVELKTESRVEFGTESRVKLKANNREKARAKKKSFLASFLFLVTLTLTLFIGFLSPAQAAFNVPARPQPITFFNDYSHSLSSREGILLESKLKEFARTHNAEIVIVIVNSLNGTPKERVATEIFNKWQIGVKGKESGLLLLIALKDRQYFFNTGSGTEGVLPDIVVNNVAQEVFVPYMRKGNLFQALDRTVTTFSGILDGEYGGVERWKKSSSRSNDDESDASFYVTIIFLFVWLLMFFGVALMRGRRAAMRVRAAGKNKGMFKDSKSGLKEAAKYAFLGALLSRANRRSRDDDDDDDFFSGFGGGRGGGFGGGGFGGGGPSSFGGGGTSGGGAGGSW